MSQQEMQCAKCREFKPESEFYEDSHWCMDCEDEDFEEKYRQEQIARMEALRDAHREGD